MKLQHKISGINRKRLFGDSIKVTGLLVIAALLVVFIGTEGSGYSNRASITFQSGVSPSPAYNGVEDAFISQSAPEENFGNSSEIKVDGSETKTAGDDVSALLRWDISAIPQGSKVESVQVQLHITNGTGTPYPIYALNRGWLASQVTWSHLSSAIRWQAPGASGGKDQFQTVLGYAGMASPGNQTIDLNANGISAVQQWVDDPSSNFGFIIHDTDLEDGLAFASSEASSPADRPGLTITYHPPGNPSVVQPATRTPQHPSGAGSSIPKYTILMIGDGMGQGVIDAAGIYAHGNSETLSFEKFPSQAEMTTRSADDPVTDSAASATAMATGKKVNNGVLSLAIPGDSSDLTTILEAYRGSGKRTGLVTSSFITDATPAAFAAHEASRYNSAQIVDDYFNQTRPNLLLGGGGNGLTPQAAKNAGYTVVQDRQQLQKANLNQVEYLSGQFGDAEIPYEVNGVGNLPHLSEMTRAALDMLEEDPDGFFLMVEGGNIDHAEHGHDLKLAVGEVLEFDRSVQVVMDWAAAHPDALVIVTADHETGGLKVVRNNGQGKYPIVLWTAQEHTSARVPVYALGSGADRVQGTLDNTDIPRIIFGSWPALPKTERTIPTAGLPYLLGEWIQELPGVSLISAGS